MAVTERDAPTPNDEYEGLSTDTRPADVFPGDVFLETDTGRRYSWTGIAWTPISTNELQLRLLWSINRHLESLAAAQDSDEPEADG